MSTYSFFDIPEKGAKPPGSKFYSDYLMVNRALQGGIPPAKLACGIMSASQKHPNVSKWNASTLEPFAQWLTGLGVGGMDVWRNDIDVESPDPTAPWMLGVLDRFRNSGYEYE